MHAAAPVRYNLLSRRPGCPGALPPQVAEGGGGKLMVVGELRMWGGGEEISWHHIGRERSVDSQHSRKKAQANKKEKKVQLQALRNYLFLQKREKLGIKRKKKKPLAVNIGITSLNSLLSPT